MQGRLIDGALYGSPDLTATAIAVLIVHQQIGQIAMPQIAVKAIAARLVNQPVDALIEQRR